MTNVELRRFAFNSEPFVFGSPWRSLPTKVPKGVSPTKPKGKNGAAMKSNFYRSLPPRIMKIKRSQYKKTPMDSRTAHRPIQTISNCHLPERSCVVVFWQESDALRDCDKLGVLPLNWICYATTQRLLRWGWTNESEMLAALQATSLCHPQVLRARG